MRSWETAHVSLNSLLTAQIDGTIKADLNLLQSQHLGNSAMGMITKQGLLAAVPTRWSRT